MATAKTLAIRNFGTVKITVRNKFTGKHEIKLKPCFYLVGKPLKSPRQLKAPSRRDLHRFDVAKRKAMR